MVLGKMNLRVEFRRLVRKLRKPFPWLTVSRPVKQGCPPVPAVVPLHEKKVKERRTSLLILTDMPGYPRKSGRTHEKFLAKRFARYTEVYHFDGPILGSAHAVITVEKVVRDVGPGMVLIGLGHVDTRIRVGNDRPELSIEEFVSNLEAIFTRLHRAGFMPVFFDALPITYDRNDASIQAEQRLKKCYEVTSSYNRAARQRLAELGFSVIPLDEFFLAHSRFYANNGKSLSEKGLQHLLHRLDAFAEPRIKIGALAAARGESVVETQQRFNAPALVQKLPNNYPPL